MKYVMPTCNDHPLVSVIVLGYEQYKYIDQTLRSIFSQDYPNIEIIISDDGSEIFPEKNIYQMAEEAGRKIRCIRHSSNLGLTKHANTAASYSSGKFIKFLSPGDGFCSTHALYELVMGAKQYQTQIVISPAKVCKKSFDNVRYVFPSHRRVMLLQNKTADRLFSIVAGANIIAAVGAIYKRSFFFNGGFDENYRNLDDWPTWLRIYRNGERIPIIKEPLVYYMVGEGLASSCPTAFQSSVLRNDLILCIQREILPWKHKLSKVDNWIVNYHLLSLQDGKDYASGFSFFPLRFFYWVKKNIKRLVVGK